MLITGLLGAGALGELGQVGLLPGLFVGNALQKRCHVAGAIEGHRRLIGEKCEEPPDATRPVAVESLLERIDAPVVECAHGRHVERQP